MQINIWSKRVAPGATFGTGMAASGSCGPALSEKYRYAKAHFHCNDRRHGAERCPTGRLSGGRGLHRKPQRPERVRRVVEAGVACSVTVSAPASRPGDHNRRLDLRRFGVLGLQAQLPHR
jgi:hypothetical protein